MRTKTYHTPKLERDPHTAGFRLAEYRGSKRPESVHDMTQRALIASIRSECGFEPGSASVKRDGWEYGPTHTVPTKSLALSASDTPPKPHGGGKRKGMRPSNKNQGGKKPIKASAHTRMRMREIMSKNQARKTTKGG